MDERERALLKPIEDRANDVLREHVCAPKKRLNLCKKFPPHGKP